MRPVNPEWNAYKLADWVLSMGHSEIDWLKEQVALLSDDPAIVNIGAAAGVSTLAMLEVRDDLRVYSCEVDPNAGEAAMIKKAGLDKMLVWRLGESAQAGKDFEDWADFIFVDGGHDFDQVTADITAWLPHLVPNGIIAFHDYHNPNLPDVKRGVDLMIGDMEIIADIDTIRAYRK